MIEVKKHVLATTMSAALGVGLGFGIYEISSAENQHLKERTALCAKHLGSSSLNTIELPEGCKADDRGVVTHKSQDVYSGTSSHTEITGFTLPASNEYIDQNTYYGTFEKVASFGVGLAVAAGSMAIYLVGIVQRQIAQNKEPNTPVA